MDTKSFEKFDDREHLRYINPGIVEKDLRTLVAIFEGINSDDLFNEIENSQIYNWINELKIYEDRQPYKDIINTIRYSLSDGVLSLDEIESIVWFCQQYIQKNGYYTQLTAGIQRLIGLLKGISIDNDVNAKEIHYISNWLEEHDYLKNTYPYDEIYSLITNIVRDQVISVDERNDLLEFCKLFTDESAAESGNNFTKSIKQGFYQIDPDIIIQEKNFCITGLSLKFKRKEIAEKIELFGGFVTNTVTSNTDYLIVCDEKNVAWSFTCYGKKVEKAISLRKQGKLISIIHEFDLYDKFLSLEK